MSTIEDVRKVLQDLVAPELQSLHAKIDGVGQTVEARFQTVDAKLETMGLRITSLERELSLRIQNLDERSVARNELILAKLETFGARLGARFDAIEKKMDTDRAEILRMFDTDKRISSLEGKVAAASAMEPAPAPPAVSAGEPSRELAGSTE